MEKTYDMYTANECQRAGFQKFDRVQIDEVVKIIGREKKMNMNVEWITYPSKQAKETRIETTLQPIFAAKKVFLMPGMEWLVDELMSFPRSSYFDGCDTMCNIVKIAYPVQGGVLKEFSTPIREHIKALKRGVVRHLDGTYPKKPSIWDRFS